MRKDAGLSGDIDRIPQFAWLLFLKAFDDLEEERLTLNRSYRSVLPEEYRWRVWAGDPDTRLTGEPLLRFVNDRLLVYLASLTGAGRSGVDGAVRDTLGQVFKETRNRMVSGYLLADLISQVEKVSFTSQDDIHTMAHMYESMLREMRDAAGDAGEFYTPRPVIRFMVQQIAPRIGETVLDPACGTGGFLTEAYEFLRQQATSPSDLRKIRESIRGFEKKPLPYLLAQMNLLLHGADGALVRRGNALPFSLTEQRRDGVSVVLTNPPFGGEEEATVLDYYPSALRTTETSWLFLQAVMARIERAPGGRCAVVMPNAVLFDQGVGGRIKKKLLQDFNLHTIVRLPPGVFAPYTPIPTNLVFFEVGGPTSEVWYYQQPLPDGRKNYTKTKPLSFDEFQHCIDWWGGTSRANRQETDLAWRVDAETIKGRSYDLDIRNPNGPAEAPTLTPDELLNSLVAAEYEILDILQSLQKQVEGWTDA
ncbi:MAG: SAM-dependent methyltransferase [Microbacteriaceae bacterium]|nr:SAM-dependent methyltransferase [Microbacteriaceae bacterium]